MNRQVMVAAMLVVGGCQPGSSTVSTAVTTANQGAYAAEQAYTVAARAEVTFAPLATPAQVTTMKALDQRVYADVKAIRAAVAVGTDLTALLATFQTDLAPLTALVNAKGAVQ